MNLMLAIVNGGMVYSALPLAGTARAAKKSFHPNGVPLRGSWINGKGPNGTFQYRSSRGRSWSEGVPAEGVHCSEYLETLAPSYFPLHC